MKLFFTTIFFAITTTLYAISEYIIIDDKVKFLYDEQQKIVTEFNQTATTVTLVNSYTKPTVEEIQVSTSCRIGRNFKDIILGDKELILKCIEVEILKLKAAEEVNDIQKIKDSIGRIGILKFEYNK